MLEAEEADDGYFTPVASTTLASIFKDDSSNDSAVNPSLKYKPPQLKKTKEISKPDDAGASQCVFSCSVIAYQWVQSSHTCKGKVGFAVMRTAKSNLCKIILYSLDKSTLSCTTLVPHLEVSLKDTMISLYDDHKKYWGLCFNNKTIAQVKEVLCKQNIIIKDYVNPETSQPEIPIFESDSDEVVEETDNSGLAEDGAVTLRNKKASILNRIANVGHAILPTLPGSPSKKTMPFDMTSSPEICDSSDKLHLLPDVSKNHQVTMQGQEPTKSIAIQTCKSNVEANDMPTNNIIGHAQTSVTSLPLVNNQIFTYVNGYMVPLHMQVPVLDNVNGANTSADIELIIHKLTQLKGVVKTMETKHLQSKEAIQICKCKVKKEGADSGGKNKEVQTDLGFKHISDLEQSIREKNTIIKAQHQQISDLDEKIEKLKEDINKKNEEIKQMIPKMEADILLAGTVKNLMNNTFRSLSSNFDNDISYAGNSIRAILAAVIKKNTVESLSTLLSNEDSDKTIQPST